MGRHSKTGVRGLSKLDDGRWAIDLKLKVVGADGVRRLERYRETLEIGIKADVARAHATNVLGGMKNGTLKPGAEPVPKLHKALDEYLIAMETERPKSYRTRKSLTVAIKAGLGDVDVTAIEAFTVERYKRDRTKGRAGERDPVGPATVNREVAVIKHFAGYAVGRGWLTRERCAAVRAVKMMKEPPGRVRYLSPDEEGRLFAELGKTVKTICEVSDLSGLRRAEVVRLEKAAVDLHHGVITLTRTKSNKVRRIPINPALAPILAAQLARTPAGCPWVFVSPRPTGDGKVKPYSLDAVSRAFARAVKRAKIENLHLHDLRHDFATKVRRAGHGIDVIADLLGHAEITTSARYAHVEDSLTRAAVAGLAAPVAGPPAKREIREIKAAVRGVARRSPTTKRAGW